VLSQFVNLLDIANSIEVFQIFATFPEFIDLLMFVRRAHPACQMQLGCAVWESKNMRKPSLHAGIPSISAVPTPKKHSASLAIQLQRKSLLLCCFMIVFNKIPTQTFHQTKICALLLGIIQ